MQRRELLWRIAATSRSLLPAVAPGAGHDVRIGSGSTEDWQHALELFRQGAHRPVLLDRRRALAIAQRRPEFAAAVIDSADRAAHHRFVYFGYPDVTLAHDIDWHYDPVAQVRWPDAASARIDHRVAAGDVKWIWELNRLQHLTWLAQAWLFTGDSRYSCAAFGQIDSWVSQNPTGRGIAWRGAFEAGIRAISVAVALQGLRDAPELTVDRYRRIVELLAASAAVCWRDRSRFSSANNHLVGEMAGLAVVAIMVPELRTARQWETRAVAALCTEAERQILPDGSGAEQAVGYQMFTIELLHLVATLLALRDGEPPQPISAAIARSCEYLTAVVGRDDPDPRYGDDDEGFALRLGHEPVRTVRDHLGIVAPLGCGPTDATAARDSLAAQWFLEATRSLPLCRASESCSGIAAAKSLFAPDGGFVVLRDGARRVTMDVGTLGYLSIAAHGHADALAITLSDDGHQLIEDPGTASYYGHPQWRSVMRGTAAHATVTVDNQDQSVSGGAFLWSKHARTTVKGVDLSAGIVDAEHDGYTRLKGAVVHRRWLVAPPGDRAVLVVDLISGGGCHEFRSCWPLSPELAVQRIEGGHGVHRDAVQVLQIRYAATSPVVLTEVRGDVEGNLGWSSARLESRTPAWWLNSTCTDAAPVVMATLLTPADGVSTSDLRVDSADGHIRIAWAEAGTTRRVTIDITESAAVTLMRVGSPVQGTV